MGVFRQAGKGRLSEHVKVIVHICLDDVRRDIIKIRMVFFIPGPASGSEGDDRRGSGRVNRLQEEQDVK